MKSRLSYWLSITVLAVFALYLVPHEVVHVFYDHHDTEHSDSHGAETTLSPIHIHCDFLSTELTDFLPSSESSPMECSEAAPFFYQEIEVQTVPCIAILRDSRGPPVS